MNSGPNDKGIYFDSTVLGDPCYEYVCWLDVMGTSNQMLRSLPIAANFIFKLHVALLEACEQLTAKGRSDIRLYPVMDGAYITSKTRGALVSLLEGAMVRMAITFVREPAPFHRFLPRGAIAYGCVYHGMDLPDKANYILANNSEIRDAILMGIPVAEAYAEEGTAPPFGIAVHSSARMFAPPGGHPFRFIWIDWFRRQAQHLQPADLLCKLDEYFDWQADHHNMTGYSPESIKKHRALAREFITASEY